MKHLLAFMAAITINIAIGLFFDRSAMETFTFSYWFAFGWIACFFIYSDDLLAKTKDSD